MTSVMKVNGHKTEILKNKKKNVSERLFAVREQDTMECNTSSETVSDTKLQRYRRRLRQKYAIELANKVRISLMDSWPQVEHCDSNSAGVCACGLQREMNLSMEVEGGLVVVELDYKKHQTCGRSCEAAVYAPLVLEGKGRLVVVRFRHWGTGESFNDRLLRLRKVIGSCCFRLRKGIGCSGVEVVHVCFPSSVSNYEISVGGGGAPAEMAVETAVGTGAGAPVVADGVACGGVLVSAKRQKTVMTNLEYFEELGRSRKVFVNKERRRLEYEHSGERERLLAVEKWVLEKTYIMHRELRQTESLFTGLCTCGKLRYTNVWTETDLSPKSLIVVELDAHEHLSCTRGRESDRYMGLHWKLDRLVVVVRWNSVGHEDTAERAQDLNKVLMGVRDRIFEGENVNDVEVVLSLIHI